jgi:hypothetical protein
MMSDIHNDIKTLRKYWDLEDLLETKGIYLKVSNGRFVLLFVGDDTTYEYSSLSEVEAFYDGLCEGSTEQAEEREVE